MSHTLTARWMALALHMRFGPMLSSGRSAGFRAPGHRSATRGWHFAVAVLVLVVEAAGCGPRHKSTDGSSTERCTTNPLYDAAHCPEGGLPPSSDGGRGPVSVLAVTGTVRSDTLTPAVGVSVSARCGGDSLSTLTDDDGKYEIDVGVEGCDALVVAFDKEQFLPVLRNVPVPPPTTPVTLDVTLARLSELQCGTQYCVVDGDTVSQFPLRKFQRGWVATMSGPRALDYYAGEFLDDSGNVTELTGFGYFDFRDDTGARIGTLKQGFQECFQISADTYDWLVDVDPTTTDTVEMNAYRLDEGTGRWKKADKPAFVAYTTSYDTSGSRAFAVTKPATVAQLPDIRTGLLSSMDAQPPYWMCMPIDGSGWYAWGVTIPEQTCFVLASRDQCHAPLANGVFVARGEHFGYLARGWTGWNGETCITAAMSEPTGKDFDLDGKAGETKLLDITAAFRSSTDSRDAREIERQPASCRKPESCTRLEIDFTDYTKLDCR